MRKYVYSLLPFIWMGIIFYASAQPYEKQNIQPLLANKMDLSFLQPYVEWMSFTYNQSIVSVEKLGVEGFIEFFIRKGAHVFVFFVLCCLFYVALKEVIKITFFWNLVISLVLTIVYACFDEFHQGFTENRTSYIGDVVLDGFGAVLSVICISGVAYFVRKRPKKV